MALRFCTEGARRIGIGLTSLAENTKEKQKLVSKCNYVKALTTENQTWVYVFCRRALCSFNTPHPRLCRLGIGCTYIIRAPAYRRICSEASKSPHGELLPVNNQL